MHVIGVTIPLITEPKCETMLNQSILHTPWVVATLVRCATGSVRLNVPSSPTNRDINIMRINRRSWTLIQGCNPGVYEVPYNLIFSPHF